MQENVIFITLNDQTISLQQLKNSIQILNGSCGMLGIGDWMLVGGGWRLGVGSNCFLIVLFFGEDLGEAFFLIHLGIFILISLSIRAV